MTAKNKSPGVQAAGFEDAQAIFEIIRSYPEELVPRPVSEIVQNIDRFLVCRRGGSLAGCVSWQILPEMGSHLEPSVEIKSLAVRRDCRGEGIGKALVLAVLEHIRPLHPVQVVVLTFVPDFFRSFGFKEVPKEKLMHKIYTGCINCTKYDSPFSCPEIAMTLSLRNGGDGDTPNGQAK